MSATLIADRSTPSSIVLDTTELVDIARLAPVVPIRLLDPGAPIRPVRRPSAPPVSRRAGSRGPRYRRGNAPGEWHLSRRGEVLLRRVTVAVAAIVVILVVAAAGFALTRGLGVAPTQTRAIVVQPGQSLWQVAASVSPDADVSATTEQIRVLNNLDATPLTPGQTLLVPVTR